MKNMQKDITTVMLCSSFVLKINLWSISIHFADLDTLICKENDWFPAESTREGPWSIRNDHGLITNDNGPSKYIFVRHEGDYHKIGTKDIGRQVVLLGPFHLEGGETVTVKQENETGERSPWAASLGRILCPFPGSCSSLCCCVWHCSPSSPWSTGMLSVTTFWIYGV